jgi:glycerol-1-phosphate dehydrogenase [NAD(P)+]
MEAGADSISVGGFRDTRAVVTARGCLRQAAELFRTHFPGEAAVIVADENTYAAAGREVRRILKAAGLEGEEPFLFPGSPRPASDSREADRLAASLRRHAAVPLAVGSGTINDLVKRAAFESGRPYMAVATAASVDGYAAFGASLSKEGFKQHLPCPAPRVILADTDILKTAPYAMTAAGFGDLAAKTVAGSDWLIAAAVAGEPVDIRGWDLVQPGLHERLAEAEELRRGSPGALGRLFEGLTASGLAIQAVGSSRPASGSEHFFSHIWEMRHLEQDGQPVYHGFLVALGTLTCTALTEALFSREVTENDAARALAGRPGWSGLERQIRAAFGGQPCLEAVLAESRAKFPDDRALAGRLAAAAAAWPDLRARVAERLLPSARLRATLEAAGCPLSPEAINLTREDWRATCFQARMIRRRYTVLDLAWELGRLEECVEEIFAPGGCF